MLAVVESEIRPAVLHVKEAAAYIGASVTYLYQLMGHGAIPFAKVGRRTVLRVADLDAYLTKRVGSSSLGRPVGSARKAHEEQAGV